MFPSGAYQMPNMKLITWPVYSLWASLDGLHMSGVFIWPCSFRKKPHVYVICYHVFYSIRRRLVSWWCALTVNIIYQWGRALVKSDDGGKYSHGVNVIYTEICRCLLPPEVRYFWLQPNYFLISSFGSKEYISLSNTMWQSISWAIPMKLPSCTEKRVATSGTTCSHNPKLRCHQ